MAFPLAVMAGPGPTPPPGHPSSPSSTPKKVGVKKYDSAVLYKKVINTDGSGDGFVFTYNVTDSVTHKNINIASHIYEDLDRTLTATCKVTLADGHTVVTKTYSIPIDHPHLSAYVVDVDSDGRFPDFLTIPTQDEYNVLLGLLDAEGSTIVFSQDVKFIFSVYNHEYLIVPPSGGDPIPLAGGDSSGHHSQTITVKGKVDADGNYQGLTEILQHPEIKR